MFFWKNGFYSDQIHFTTDENGEKISTIPPDAVPVSDGEYAALLEAQSAGKQIVTGPDGAPVAQDPPPPTPDDQVKQFEQAVTASLEAFAQERGWDSLDRVLQQTGAFAADAAIAQAAYDGIWQTAFPLIDQIRGETLTLDEALAQLPKPVWPENI
jgi:hypothetical protein